MSTGDKATIALAFFLAGLDSDKEISNKIVVFDDPFNSQDAFRRSETIHQIRNIGKKCKQIIVLSHDQGFLKEIWDKSLPNECATLNIKSSPKGGSKILEMDLKNISGRTLEDIKDLQAYLDEPKGQEIDIIRKMRTVLETYLRMSYIIHFEEKEYLGNMVGKIREAPDHPAFGLYDNLSKINDYTAPFHHGESILDGKVVAIDPTELTGFVKKTLKIINAFQG